MEAGTNQAPGRGKERIRNDQHAACRRTPGDLVGPYEWKLHPADALFGRWEWENVWSLFIVVSCLLMQPQL